MVLCGRKLSCGCNPLLLNDTQSGERASSQMCQEIPQGALHRRLWHSQGQGGSEAGTVHPVTVDPADHADIDLFMEVPLHAHTD